MSLKSNVFKTIALLISILSISACQNDNAKNKKETSGTPNINKFTPIEPEYSIITDEEISKAGQANDAKYSVKNVLQDEDNPLKGKKIYWLGSSVTYGSASESESMADFLAAKAGCISVKEAVSGTTLFDDNASADTGEKSYVRRLKTSKNFNVEDKIDAFVCQISTNDCTSARLNKRGTISPNEIIEKEKFNTKTTLGAIEYIISYVTENWECPIYFYSGAHFTDGSNKAERQNSNPKGSDYGKLVEQVHQIADKFNEYAGFHVEVIDLFNDEKFNNQVSKSYYSWATSDPIHPKKAGYLQWWTPYFEAHLINSFGEYEL